jgi:xylulokinase
VTVFAGIDLGTSGIKIGLVDETGTCLAAADRRSPVDIPQAGWSQQDPEQWWTLTTEIFDELTVRHPDLLARLVGISLSGHMLGQVLLDRDDRPTTPCILWNDQRAIAECAELSTRVPDIGRRANGQPDPGLTAPKLLWLAKHVPDALDRADMLLLPKDYVRLKLTGERLSEVSDASGTMMLDCATGTWDDELIRAAGWDRAKLPSLVRSYDAAGDLRPSLRRRWGCPGAVTVAAGSGDNYAGALGIGAALPGRAALSIGTSGVLSAVDGRFHPAPERAILTTPHAAPDTFLSMAVVMSATQSLDWLATLLGLPAAELARMAERRVAEGGIAGRPLARPSLTGLRTPENRPDASAFFGGIRADHDRDDLAYSILEGVAFQFFDGMRAQRDAGVPIDDIAAIGGGTRSLFWIELLASLFDRPITVPRDGSIAACLGAARLAMAATRPADRDAILMRRPQSVATVDPNPALRGALLERFRLYQHLPFTLDHA